MDAARLTMPLDALPDPLPLPPPGAYGSGGVEIRPPGSKSITNRALLLAGLVDGETVLRRPLVEADDARRMVAALGLLGAEVREDGDALRVRGVGGRWRVDGPARLDLNNAGTATRFLAAAAMLSPHAVTIDGNARMRQRPIGELAALLEALGARVGYEGAAGYPPVAITAPDAVDAGATVDVGRTQSSQFVSALLLCAPWLPGGLRVRYTDEPTSASYIRMTLGLLRSLGVRVDASDDLREIVIHPGPLDGFTLDVEPDASGATYWWGAGALAGGRRVRVPGLGDGSLQGDAGFPALLERMGATVERNGDGTAVSVQSPLRAIDADMADMPDAAMTLAVVAAFAEGTTTLRGVRTLRVKECDRITATRVELAKIGVVVEETVGGDDDVMTVTPPAGGVDCSGGVERVAFDTYDDHRMAMALSLVALRRPNVVINEPACVAKTYPSYWADFARLMG